MTNEELGRLKSLCDAATDGPWWYEPKLQHVRHEDSKGSMQVADIRGWGHLTGKGHGAHGMAPEDAKALQDANGALIAASREAIPALIAEVRTLRAELDALKAQQEKES